MMRPAVAVAMAVAMAVAWCGAAPGAQAAAPPVDLVAQAMSGFERNVALGTVLQMREGTQTELAELQTLFERGLRAAREAVAQRPGAEAHYALGSWLLYGYRPVTTEVLSFDAQGAARTQTVSQAVQGAIEDPQEGLDALRRSVELAPANGDYLLDYAAALADYERGREATTVLRAVWAGQPELSTRHKMRAGFLLAGIAQAEGDLAGARQWIYSALSLDPEIALVVEQLRYLDVEQAAEARWAAEPFLEEVYETEGAPEQPSEDWDEDYWDEDDWYEEEYIYYEDELAEEEWDEFGWEELEEGAWQY